MSAFLKRGGRGLDRLGGHRPLHKQVDQFLRNGRQDRRGLDGRPWFAWHTCSLSYVLCLKHKIYDRPSLRVAGWRWPSRLSHPPLRLRLFASVSSPPSLRLRLFASVLSPPSFRLGPFASVLSPRSFRLGPFASVLSPRSFRLRPFASVSSSRSFGLPLRLSSSASSSALCLSPSVLRTQLAAFRTPTIPRDRRSPLPPRPTARPRPFAARTYKRALPPLAMLAQSRRQH
jgi:hypothetical protein